MYKTIIMATFIVLMIAVLFLASNLKDAYKILPGPTTTETPIEDPYASWREFIPQAENFKVLLPAVPQYAKEAVNIPNTEKKRRYEMYAAEKINGPVFMISVIAYPEDFDTSNTNEMLHGVIDELVASNVDNRLLETRDNTFQDRPTVDFHMVNKEFDIEGKAFVVNKTVYVLTYVARNTDYDKVDYQYFINSFELLPKDSEKT